MISFFLCFKSTVLSFEIKGFSSCAKNETLTRCLQLTSFHILNRKSKRASLDRLLVFLYFCIAKLRNLIEIRMLYLSNNHLKQI